MFQRGYAGKMSVEHTETCRHMQSGQYNILIPFLIILNHYVSIAQGTVEESKMKSKGTVPRRRICG